MRQWLRAAGFVSQLLFATIELCWLAVAGRLRSAEARAAWLQRLSRKLVRLLGLSVEYRGEPAETGLLVFNHVSYLDILVLAARRPMVFVAKKEVRSWPVIGWLAAQAGTVFIDRARRSDVARVSDTISRLIAQGVPVCIFPEGTSSDGSSVLPFRTSLLEPVIATACPVTVGWIGYAMEDGDAATEACYWGDSSFGPHLWNLFAKRRVDARAVYEPADAAGQSRKEFGAALHAQVCTIAKRWM